MPPTRKSASATAEKSVIDERFDEQNIKFEKLFEQNNKLIELLTRVIEENSVLRGKVENLEKIVIDQQNVVVEEVVEDIVDIANVVPKKKFDVLLLSDSIYRHVGIAVPKEARQPNETRQPNPPPIYREFSLSQNNVSCLKVVIPGAKAARLYEEAQLLSATHDFKEIILHCGANHLPTKLTRSQQSHQHLDDIRDETLANLYKLHTSVQALFKSAAMTFSPILPQLQQNGPPPGLVCVINTKMDMFCTRNKFSFLRPLAFGRHGVQKLICKDGIHLSFDGVAELTSVLEKHFMWKSPF